MTTDRQRIDEDRLVRTFCELVAVDAPPLEEKVMFETMRGRLEALGFEVREDDAAAKIGGQCGNLYAFLPGCGDAAKTLPAVLFAAHLDTVMPARGKRAVVESDGVIRSDGTTVLGADDIAGLAAILEAIRALREDKAEHRPIELFCSVAEEMHLTGAHEMRVEWLEARQAYVLDNSGPPGIATTSAPGMISLEAEVLGKASHAGIAPADGISAITVAARAIAAMQLGQVDEKTTANVGRIEGGGATNIVTASCRISAECRSRDGQRLREQADHMRACLEEAAHQAGASVQIKEKTHYIAYAVPPDSQTLARFKEACAALGLDCRLKPGGGGSDNNVLVLKGIDGLVISCGMTDVHSCAESIRIRDLVDLARQIRYLAGP